MGQNNQLWWNLPSIESLYLNKCIYEIDDVDYRKTLDKLSRRKQFVVYDGKAADRKLILEKGKTKSPDMSEDFAN